MKLEGESISEAAESVIEDLEMGALYHRYKYVMWPLTKRIKPDPIKRGWPIHARAMAAAAVILVKKAQEGGKQRWVRDVRAMFEAMAGNPEEVPTPDQLRKWVMTLSKTMEKWKS